MKERLEELVSTRWRKKNRHRKNAEWMSLVFCRLMQNGSKKCNKLRKIANNAKNFPKMQKISIIFWIYVKSSKIYVNFCYTVKKLIAKFGKFCQIWPFFAKSGNQNLATLPNLTKFAKFGIPHLDIFCRTLFLKFGKKCQILQLCQI